jgi:uncharacterized membrane protein YeaQ/YmgE (transglycosylase-associated protein family)
MPFGSTILDAWFFGMAVLGLSLKDARFQLDGSPAGSGFKSESTMPDALWLFLTGMLVGLVTRKIMSERAYGAIADMLLGMTGAFASSWLIENLARSTIVAWNVRLLFVIWGAAALPFLARFLAKHDPFASRHFSHPRSGTRDSAKT